MSGEDPLVPTGLDQRLSKLMECLQQKRCLLILDNAETILSSGEQAGYRAGYEGYGNCFGIGESLHQSCVDLNQSGKAGSDTARRQRVDSANDWLSRLRLTSLQD